MFFCFPSQCALRTVRGNGKTATHSKCSHAPGLQHGYYPPSENSICLLPQRFKPCKVTFRHMCQSLEFSDFATTGCKLGHMGQMSHSISILWVRHEATSHMSPRRLQSGESGGIFTTCLSWQRRRVYLAYVFFSSLFSESHHPTTL